MATLLDGRKLARRVLDEVCEGMRASGRKLSLAVVSVGSDAASEEFIARKRKIAEELGVDFRVYASGADISTNDLRKRIAVIVHDANPTGIVVQLPLPAHINAQHVLNAVPTGKNVDVLSARSLGNFSVGKSEIVPPVVGAVKAFFDEYKITLEGKNVVVVGAGNLVGRPLVVWLLNQKATFSLVRSTTPDIAEFTRRADILITGVGKPGLINGDMVKDGAVVIDAGTSEVGGKPAGDVEYDSVSAKASYLTPVPGGVGPVTVAMIYRNLVALAGEK